MNIYKYINIIHAKKVSVCRYSQNTQLMFLLTRHEKWIQQLNSYLTTCPSLSHIGNHKSLYEMGASYITTKSTLQTKTEFQMWYLSCVLVH